MTSSTQTAQARADAVAELRASNGRIAAALESEDGVLAAHEMELRAEVMTRLQSACEAAGLPDEDTRAALLAEEAELQAQAAAHFADLRARLDGLQKRAHAVRKYSAG